MIGEDGGIEGGALLLLLTLLILISLCYDIYRISYLGLLKVIVLYSDSLSTIGSADYHKPNYIIIARLRDVSY